MYILENLAGNKEDIMYTLRDTCFTCVSRVFINTLTYYNVILENTSTFI